MDGILIDNKINMAKLSLILIISLTIIVIMFRFFFYNKISDQTVVYKVKEIHSEKFNTSIFLKQKVWGLTFDNQTIIISKIATRVFNPNHVTDYIYEGLSPFYYKFYHDTLFVYSMKNSKIPQRFKIEIKIIQKELENPEMMRLIKDNQYKNEGLNVIE